MDAAAFLRNGCVALRRPGLGPGLRKALPQIKAVQPKSVQLTPGCFLLGRSWQPFRLEVQKLIKRVVSGKLLKNQIIQKGRSS
jgi:hypothetical protein